MSTPSESDCGVMLLQLMLLLQSETGSAGPDSSAVIDSPFEVKEVQDILNASTNSQVSSLGDSDISSLSGGEVTASALAPRCFESLLQHPAPFTSLLPTAEGQLCHLDMSVATESFAPIVDPLALWTQQGQWAQIGRAHV